MEENTQFEKNNDLEHVHYAGFWIRVLANTIDSFIIFIPMFLVNLLIGLSTIPFADNSNPDSMSMSYLLITMILDYAIYILYYGFMTSSSNQGTLGKMAVGIKVTDVNGNKLTLGHSIGRFFAFLLSSMTFYIGFIMVGLTDKKKGLHDYMANTYVVYK